MIGLKTHTTFSLGKHDGGALIRTPLPENDPNAVDTNCIFVGDVNYTAGSAGLSIVVYDLMEQRVVDASNYSYSNSQLIHAEIEVPSR